MLFLDLSHVALSTGKAGRQLSAEPEGAVVPPLRLGNLNGKRCPLRKLCRHELLHQTQSQQAGIKGDWIHHLVSQNRSSSASTAGDVVFKIVERLKPFLTLAHVIEARFCADVGAFVAII